MSANVLCSRAFLKRALQLPAEPVAFYWDFDNDSLVIRLAGNRLPISTLIPADSTTISWLEVGTDEGRTRIHDQLPQS